MTDEEYIRKAVELADGWRGRANSYTSPNGRYVWCGDPDQETLDALAAQLVRQVDALKGMCVTFYVDQTRVHSSDGCLSVASRIDEGRTMNTIKAIVDSRVLE